MNPGDVIAEAMNMADFNIILAGNNLIHVKKFSFGQKATYEFNDGPDGEPITYSVKNFRRTSKVTTTVEDLLYLISVSPGGDVLKWPGAPIVAESYVDGGGGVKIEIPRVRIEEANLDFDKSKPDMEVPIGLAVLGYPRISVT